MAPQDDLTFGLDFGLDIDEESPSPTGPTALRRPCRPPDDDSGGDPREGGWHTSTASGRGNVVVVDVDGVPALFALHHPLAMVYGGGGVFGIGYTAGVAAGLAAAGGARDHGAGA